MRPYVAAMRSPKDQALAMMVHRRRRCREYSLRAPRSTSVSRPRGMPSACRGGPKDEGGDALNANPNPASTLQRVLF